MTWSENRKTTFRDHAVAEDRALLLSAPQKGQTDRFQGRSAGQNRGSRNTARALEAREVRGI